LNNKYILFIIAVLTATLVIGIYTLYFPLTTETPGSVITTNNSGAISSSGSGDLQQGTAVVVSNNVVPVQDTLPKKPVSGNTTPN
jgi:hypothetical protein